MNSYNDSNPAQKPSQPAEEGGNPQAEGVNLTELQPLPTDSMQVRAKKILARADAYEARMEKDKKN